jgi:hypothetical protein
MIWLLVYLAIGFLLSRHQNLEGTRGLFMFTWGPLFVTAMAYLAYLWFMDVLNGEEYD